MAGWRGAFDGCMTPWNCGTANWSHLCANVSVVNLVKHFCGCIFHGFIHWVSKQKPFFSWLWVSKIWENWVHPICELICSNKFKWESWLLNSFNIAISPPKQDLGMYKKRLTFVIHKKKKMIILERMMVPLVAGKIEEIKIFSLFGTPERTHSSESNLYYVLFFPLLPHKQSLNPLTMERPEK